MTILHRNGMRYLVNKKIRMKQALILFIVVIGLAACGNKTKAPDVSNISVDLKVERFDRDFFALDTNHTESGMVALQEKYPVLLPLYLQGILGVFDPAGVNSFYQYYKPVYDSVQKAFPDFDGIAKEIGQSFRYVKHYFPAYELPRRIIPIVGPMNAADDLPRKANGEYTAVFGREDFVGISLQFYLGKDFSLYNVEYFINNVAPLYISRRFEKQYIVPDVMKLIVDDLYPDESQALPLIGQIIEKGKRWWLLDKLMPHTADSLKTGYTGLQTEWVEHNEGAVWASFIKNVNLQATDRPTIQTFIGDAPFTQFFSQEFAPGNIGPWFGRQIVRKFAANNSSLTIDEIMKKTPQEILDDAKYKPK